MCPTLLYLCLFRLSGGFLEGYTLAKIYVGHGYFKKCEEPEHDRLQQMFKMEMLTVD